MANCRYFDPELWSLTRSGFTKLFIKYNYGQQT